MAITIGPVTLPRSADELLDATDGYGAGALVQLESSATEGGSYAFVASEAIVAGREAVYFRDASGTSATWYRTWLSKSDGSQPSARSAAFQVGSVVGYVTVAEAKAYLGVSDTEDDGWLPFVVSSVNAEVTRRVGILLGPSPDAVRTYDGHAAVRQGRRLWVPGGIRTLAQVRTRDEWGGTWTTRTLSDFALAPEPYGLPGRPYARVEVGPDADPLPSGTLDVELTGTFGWEAVPDDLAGLARMLVARLWGDRNAGSPSDAPSTASRFVFKADAEMMEQYRRDWVGLGIA